MKYFTYLVKIVYSFLQKEQLIEINPRTVVYHKW